MSIGFWQIMAIVLVLVLLFGRGKISELMADTAKGIKSFKKGLADDEVTDDAATNAKVIENAPSKSEEQSKAS